MGRTVPTRGFTHYKPEAFYKAVCTAALQSCVTEPNFWCIFREMAKRHNLNTTVLIENCEDANSQPEYLPKKRSLEFANTCNVFLLLLLRKSILDNFLKINLASVGN